MVQDNTKRCASKLIMVLFKKHTHLEKTLYRELVWFNVI